MVRYFFYFLIFFIFFRERERGLECGLQHTHYMYVYAHFHTKNCYQVSLFTSQAPTARIVNWCFVLLVLLCGPGEMIYAKKRRIFPQLPWTTARCWFKPMSAAVVLYTCVYTTVVTSLVKEVMFLAALVCLFICLSVCGQHYSKSYEWIGMKFYGGVLGSTLTNWLNFGGDLGILR